MWRIYIRNDSVLMIKQSADDNIVYLLKKFQGKNQIDFDNQFTSNLN